MRQRNKHLQTTLIEAAKMAPRYSRTLARLYDREKQRGNANRATLAVARKLVAYLMAVDRGQTHFLTLDREARTAAYARPETVFAARACQVSPLTRLGTRAKLPMLPLISFETGRRTHSIIWAADRCTRQWKSGSIHE